MYNILDQQGKSQKHGNSEILNFYQKVLIARNSNVESTAENVQHSLLKPILRPYQMQAVQWMLQQERREISRESMFILYLLTFDYGKTWQLIFHLLITLNM